MSLFHRILLAPLVTEFVEQVTVNISILNILDVFKYHPKHNPKTPPPIFSANSEIISARCWSDITFDPINGGFPSMYVSF